MTAHELSIACCIGFDQIAPENKISALFPLEEGAVRDNNNNSTSCLHVTGPPVPIAAGVHSTHRRPLGAVRDDTYTLM
eukprot:8837185-Pyramimonas_sp.AAC.1